MCCQGKSDNYATGGKPDQRRRGCDRRQSNNANFVGDGDASDSEENCAFAFAVTENQRETCKATRLEEPVLEVNINGITTRVLIDSGSVSNLIGMEEYEELKAQGLKREDGGLPQGVVCIWREGVGSDWPGSS